MTEYVSGTDASKTLGVHQRTLHNWDEKKIIETIRTPGGKRLYNVKKFLDEQEKNKSNVCKLNIPKINELINKKKLGDQEKKEEAKINVIYARVSSLGQKDDLERQKEKLISLYPNHQLITDIGSGMNMNRIGLRKIIDKAIEGKINEVVVVYKDRLCRFGYELVEDIIKKYSNGKIVIVSKNEIKEPKEELVEDVLQIMNIFVAKINGMRKYKKIDTEV
jgi:predicted site-specific integrase-resolvase